MGCDIHGVWECKLPNGVWAAFREINESRSYTWFGIIANVRGRGGAAAGTCSIPWDPRDADGDTGAYWSGYCESWRGDVHSHSQASWDDVYAANAEKRAMELLNNNEGILNEGECTDHEALPALDDVVNEIWVGGHPDHGWRPNTIPMNIPLRDVLGLGPEATLDDPRVRSRIRMVMAFDN
jgi:hypothetical protein